MRHCLLLLWFAVSLPLAVAQTESPEPQTRIQATPAVDDSAIRERLGDIYTQLPELSNVTVTVVDGVARLSGTVESGEAKYQALELASRTDGVVAVNNGIEIRITSEEQFVDAWSSVVEKLHSWLDLWPKLLLAVLVVLLSWLLASFLSTRRLLLEYGVRNPFLRDLVRQFIRLAVILLGLLVALDILNATTIVGAVLGAAGVAGLAIGIAFRDTIENYIAGVILSLRQPFAPNDHVLIEGHEGQIARLTARATILVTFDGNNVRIPNSRVLNGVVVNYSRNPLRRFEFTLGIGNDVNIVAAQQLIKDTLSALNGVLDEPPPWSIVQELGDSSVALSVYGWVDQREADFAKVRSEAIRNIKEQFDAAGFDMPEPTYRIKRAETRTSETDAFARDSAASTPQSGQSKPAISVDIRPDSDIAAAVEAERKTGEAIDLLDENAPRE